MSITAPPTNKSPTDLSALLHTAIHSLINTIFGAGLTIIEQYGGDVIHFAGDALIVRWVSELERAQCACTAAMKLTVADLAPGLSKIRTKFNVLHAFPASAKHVLKFAPCEVNQCSNRLLL